MLVEPAEKNPPKRHRLGILSERRAASMSIARQIADHTRNAISYAPDYDQKNRLSALPRHAGLRHSIYVHQA